MIDKLLFLVLALYALATRGRTPMIVEPEDNADLLTRRAQEAAAAAEAARRAAAEAERARGMPASWPQAPPSLPPFPKGWEFAEPPSAAVRARAWQLLNELWARGEGSTRVEQTGGTWITYRAEITKGAKRGVVAYRVKAGARSTPKAAPDRAAAPGPAPRLVTSPGIARTPLGPILYQGAGMGALQGLAGDVKRLQARLLELKFYAGQVDGKFGPKTTAAVIAFQAPLNLPRIPLQRGTVDEATWSALRVGLSAMAS
jgi:Putative peptidoglycan binding domain